ncbi:SDR family NAD(P)-dependent oxidoreductase [Bradyrhizobium guangzhouense]|uniref:SDR family oxidoreductase n=1 Tax=Bradyrhizobium guangzhouense TaxID=1325095 RepID=A0AAE5X363_9BRAD|nr:SDR family oxidoreductase [Bradyrhizobium guangzhouense]QAU47826.1 short-chain dehydrogenase [Bradyrhizobium guangzhouense]RXH15045.1 SDR family oxidoreductase [Bradyrhizobium guangzhouense]
MGEARTTLITGGNSGIGEALAKKLVARGERVVSVGLEQPTWTHELLTAYCADLSNLAETREIAQEICRDHAIDRLVHNAGVILPNLLPDARPEDILMLAQLHLGAPMLLTQAALEGMLARRFGRIVFVSSRAAMGAATRSAYSATKAGVHGMARTWALELAASGITVNVVAPGPILTDNFWGIIPKGSEQQERMARNVPVGRLGSREDVAHAISFFLDEHSDFVTGQVLYVCGGTSLVGLGP